jgi:hypothetical protein
MRTKLTAVQVLNYLATGAEVLADDPDALEVRGFTGPSPAGDESDEDGARRRNEAAGRFARLAEELAALAEEFDAELEEALEVATSNGLADPEQEKVIR